MAMRRMRKQGSEKKETKRLSKPTNVFAKNAKKTEPDDGPGKMRGSNVGQRRGRKKLAGMLI